MTLIGQLSKKKVDVSKREAKSPVWRQMSSFAMDLSPFAICLHLRFDLSQLRNYVSLYDLICLQK